MGNSVEVLTRVVDKATDDYLRQHVLAAEMLREAGRSFDQTLITLSAGAVALSVSYLRPSAGDTPAVLYGAWASFAIALALTLVSFRLVQIPLSKDVERWAVALRRSEGGLGRARTGSMPDAAEAFMESPVEMTLRTSSEKWRAVLTALHVAALIAFMVGVCLLFYATAIAEEAGTP